MRSALLVLAFALCASTAHAQVDVSWTRDGRFVLVENAQLTDAMTTTTDDMVIELSTGARSQTWQLKQQSCMTGDPDPDAQSMTSCKEEREASEAAFNKAKKAWTRSHPAVDGDWALESSGAKVSVAVEAGKRLAKLTAPQRPDHALAMPEGGEPCKASWSPDRQWALVACGEEGAQTWALVAGVARVELLDAGAGDLSKAAAALGKAGYAPAHQGKAQTPHADTEVFFAPGFDADAKRIAEAVGARAYRPLTWSTPFAVTVALAKP